MKPTVKFGPNAEITYTRDLCVLKAAGLLADAEVNLVQIAGRPASVSQQSNISMVSTQVALAEALMRLADRLD